MNEYLVITWTDSVPAKDGLAEAVRDKDGQLPACRIRPIRLIQTPSGLRRSPAPSSPAHPGATGLAR